MRSFNTACADKDFSKGFTLLEVLIALSIISIALVSVIRLQGRTIGMCEAVKFYSLAPFLAQAKISAALKDTESYAGITSGDFGSKHPGFSWRIEVTEKQVAPNDFPEITVSEIKVRIAQTEGSGMTYTTTTCKQLEDGGTGG